MGGRRRLLLAGACLLAATLPWPATAAAASRQFQTPSGNIDCWIQDGRSVRCEIQQRSWSPPPKPKSCELDWGSGFVLGATGRARFICAGDTVQAPPDDPYPTLAYGKSLKVGAITCSSATSSLTCRNRQRHGFVLSRQRYRTF